MRTNNQSAYLDRHDQRYITKQVIDQKVSGLEQNLETLYETRFKDQFDAKLKCYKECLLLITVMFNQRFISIKQNDLGTGKQADDRSHPAKGVQKAPPQRPSSNYW